MSKGAAETIQTFRELIRLPQISSVRKSVDEQRTTPKRYPPLGATDGFSRRLLRTMLNRDRSLVDTDMLAKRLPPDA